MRLVQDKPCVLPKKSRRLSATPIPGTYVSSEEQAAAKHIDGPDKNRRAFRIGQPLMVKASLTTKSVDTKWAVHSCAKNGFRNPSSQRGFFDLLRQRERIFIDLINHRAAVDHIRKPPRHIRRVLAQRTKPAPQQTVSFACCCRQRQRLGCITTY